MEMLEDKVAEFVARSSGAGYGAGSSDGSSDGFGFGHGTSFGSGSSDGRGYGADDTGFGYRYGGIKSFNSQRVYLIDDVNTIIYSVKNNIAKGAVINDDFTLTDCYIAKVDNCFAHGKTAHEAFKSAQEKALLKEPIEKRVEMFITEFPNLDEKIPAQELFHWHYVLTGSCEFGRRHFAREHNINIETDSFTPREFIKLTKDAYGGENIKLLEKYYKK